MWEEKREAGLGLADAITFPGGPTPSEALEERHTAAVPALQPPISSLKHLTDQKLTTCRH